MKMWWWSAATMVSVLLKVAAVYSQVEISDLDKPSELCSGFSLSIYIVLKVQDLTQRRVYFTVYDNPLPIFSPTHYSESLLQMLGI